MAVARNAANPCPSDDHSTPRSLSSLSMSPISASRRTMAVIASFHAGLKRGDDPEPRSIVGRPVSGRPADRPLVRTAGLEPALLSKADFKSAASTGFATSALRPEGQSHGRRQALSDVEAGAHFLAGLEIGHALGLHLDGIARARLQAGARLAAASGEAPKPLSSTRPPPQRAARLWRRKRLRRCVPRP